jgi:monothiol glutaredoxin
MTDVKERIDALVKSTTWCCSEGQRIVSCAFSRAVAILDHLGVPFETVDVLADPEIRTGIKIFRLADSSAALCEGEFVSGSDIMMEMFESGELQQLIAAGLTGIWAAAASCRGAREPPRNAYYAKLKGDGERGTRYRCCRPLCWRGTKWTQLLVQPACQFETAV